MRHFVVVAAIAVSGMSVGLTAQKADADTEAFTRQYEQAFNKGDAKALAALHTTETVRLGADGELLHGRAAVEKHMGQTFGGPAKGARLSLRPGRVQNVTPDVRVIEGTFEVSGGSMGPLRGRYVNTLVRQEGQWRLASVTAVPESSGMAKPDASGGKK